MNFKRLKLTNTYCSQVFSFNYLLYTYTIHYISTVSNYVFIVQGNEVYKSQFAC